MGSIKHSNTEPDELTTGTTITNACFEFVTNIFDLLVEKRTFIYRITMVNRTVLPTIKLPNFPLKYFLRDNRNTIEIRVWVACWLIY